MVSFIVSYKCFIYTRMYDVQKLQIPHHHTHTYEEFVRFSFSVVPLDVFYFRIYVKIHLIQTECFLEIPRPWLISSINITSVCVRPMSEINSNKIREWKFVLKFTSS